MDKDVEQCAKALERGGLERKKASEPIEGVFGGPEYRGGCTCTSVEGSSEQISEGKASLSEQTRTWVVLGCSEGDAGDVAHVHESSRGMDKLPMELRKNSSRGS